MVYKINILKTVTLNITFSKVKRKEKMFSVSFGVYYDYVMGYVFSPLRK